MTFLIIPTYNERENIEGLIRLILDLPSGPDLNIVVVDDNSPDGTGEIVDKLAKELPNVHLISRKKLKGRGTAGIEGFRYALSQGANYIIEMDADLSHHPKYIPLFINAIKDCDVVIGSRFVKGGRDIDRGIVRRVITRLAGLYVRYLLGLRIKDVSSGYRCFRREVLEKVDVDNLISTGPSIVLEIIYNAAMNNFKIKEVPITFQDRRQGETKLDYITLLETMVMVLRLRKMHKEGK
ncbi:MAG: polyprenol monophosphomannose synthase [Thermodesulfobacteriota bacterium]